MVRFPPIRLEYCRYGCVIHAWNTNLSKITQTRNPINPTNPVNPSLPSRQAGSDCGGLFPYMELVFVGLVGVVQGNSLEGTPFIGNRLFMIT